MTRAPLPLLLALLLGLLLGLAGCSSDSDDTPPPKTAAHDAVNPCRLAFSDQQIATPLEPGSAAAEPAGVDGDLAAGLAADGVCFDVAYEMYTKGWRVIGYRITASQGDVHYSDYVPDRVYRTQFDEESKLATRPLPGLYVPLQGCVDVTGRVELAGPHGVRAAYVATGTYGRDCAAYEKRHGGA